MKILVTGAAGFIGSHLAERLAKDGHDVLGIDSFSKYYDPRLKEINVASVRESGAKVIKLDLAKDDLEESVDGVEIIYHFAAQPGISENVPFADYETNNLTATHRLLEAAKAESSLKMFVNISTSSVYGKYVSGDENVPPAPASYYGVTKLAAEQLALSYFREKGMPVCSARLFSVYGERERPEKLYPKLIKSIAEDKEFTLYEGSGDHKRSYTYVGDIVEGLVRIIGNPQVNGQIFNLGTETSITTGEGIRTIEEIMGKKAKIVSAPRRAGDQMETRASIEKAKILLGYEPKTPVKEGLRREVEWYLREVHGKI